MQSNKLIRVILVDDEEYLLKGLKNIIPWQELGFVISGVFSSGEEALLFLANQTVDVVITDIIMPTMTGIELTKIISTRYPQVTTLVLSSSNEFEHVKEALRSGAKDYILKPTVNHFSMKEFLEKNIPDSLALQTKQPATVLNAEDFSVINALPFSRAFFYGILLLKQADFPIHGIVQQIQQHNQLTNCHLFTQDNSHLLIINTDEELELRTLIDELSEKAIIFPLTTTIEDILPALDQLTNLKTEWQFYQNQEVLLWDYAWNDHTLDGMTKKNSTLQKYIQHKQWDSFEKWFNIYFVQSPFFIPREDIISIYLNLALSLYQQAASDGQTLAETKISLLKSITGKKSLAELNQEISDILTFIQRSKESSDIDRQILDYIQDNYHLKINLNDVAEHFHFNYNYLSNYFTSVIGTNFSDYINRIRIEKAKELLRQEKESINDIAEEIGFSDVGYFSKVFKKAVGLTPSKYRRSVERV
ncbi:response regulator [Vagococcus sp. BWB3-3]|uniref:Response regulator n=1 Tax=Vagococcus allomyrinae TaxID=2794353 RepID=A0A940PB15_9ENTE|nr:helix-turn-helix domain-containing protein [Vagococcus allomyrinae]MBP1044315.1 response regulator [Vagococcus allomyrinae]